MDEERLDPDLLLKTLNHLESQKKRGKLKIFFGYAAGVGKTYGMLDAAQGLRKNGVDVVIGYLEPHLRPETVAAAQGLEALPVLEMDYKGLTLKEFDLDGALARHPELILVDELAHSNVHGSRNRKRYHDVEELLQAGIDVYTTVNVQHLESLNDIVAAITHVVVQERIPDSVFDQADQVELVDIEPQELLLRLQQGKIYQNGKVEKALGHFFVAENLVALRELSLRRMADRVNKAGESSRTLGSDYYTGEHILICLSSAPSNEKVIRTAARMAEAFHGAFTALYVQTPQDQFRSTENQQRLKAYIKLAEQSKAKIATVYGEDIPSQIALYAKASGVSKIVIGRSNNKAFRWGRKNLMERLAVLAPQLDIYIIPDQNSHSRGQVGRNWLGEVTFSLTDLSKLLLIMSICTLIGLIFYDYGVSETNIVTMYILGVLVISSTTANKIYGILSSVLGVLVFNFFFTIPQYTFNAYGAGYPLTFGVMLAASLITSTLTLRVRRQAKELALKAYRTEILLETSQKLQKAGTLSEILAASAAQLIKLLERDLVIFAVEEGQLADGIIYPAEAEDVGQRPLADEKAVADWTVRNRKAAGAGTDTLPGSKGCYLPVVNQERIFAVIGIPMEQGETIAPFERSLLMAILGEISLSMETFTMDEAQKQAQMQVEKEQLRANLLRAVSHDLRTPLTTISGNAGILRSEGERLDRPTQQRLFDDIYDDSLWLINLVENLLSVTRLDNSQVSVVKTPELVEEIVNEALGHVNRRENEHRITTSLPEDFLLVMVDAKLIVQVLINVIDNAIKYTKEGSHIEIRAFGQGDQISIEVADDGTGISDEDKAKIFDLFFVSPNNYGDSRRGTGLGLSLCQSIIQAHGGEIYVKDNLPQGTIFGFVLQGEVLKNNG